MLRKQLILLLSVSLTLSLGGCRSVGYSGASQSWHKISPYFVPPASFAGNGGSYRSPLVFYNGDTVRNVSDWIHRRAEIKQRWMSLMGQWPAVIQDRQMVRVDSIRRDNFMQYRVRFYWTPNEQTEGYLLVPRRRGKKPAVITVYYEPETAIGKGKNPNRDFAYQLAKRGFVTLSLGTSRTTENKTYSLYYPSIKNAALQPLSALAYAAANAWEVLAKESEVDSTRIGIVGHSYGGKWAMFASCLYDKFACAAWGDPGIVFDESKGGYINYWEPWYLGYYPPPWKDTWAPNSMVQKGAYPLLRKEGLDLVELHALMAPRPFLVSGGYSDGTDRWTALNHSIAVNRLLGFENRVAMSNRKDHDPNVESNDIIYEFFEWYLNLSPKK